VNEAMACGLPAIVSTGVGCAPDLIEPDSTGYIFETGDVDELAETMLEAHRALASNRNDIKDAVARKISGYTCDAAVRGALEALDAVAVRVPHAVHMGSSQADARLRGRNI